MTLSHISKKEWHSCPIPTRHCPVAKQHSADGWWAVLQQRWIQTKCILHQRHMPSCELFTTRIFHGRGDQKNWNISVIVSGDSYTRQLFIGLANILLLSRPSNEEIRNQTFRLEMIERSNAEIAARHVNNTSFSDVQYPMECFWGCYGSGSSRYRFSILFSMCIRLYFIKVLLRKLLESAIVAKHNVWY